MRIIYARTLVSLCVFVIILKDLDELTSFNANNGHLGNQLSFRSKKRDSREV